MNVTLPRMDIPVAAGQPMQSEWYRWAFDITARVGGVSGQSTTDLAESQFEDAGIEEIRLGVFKLADEFGQQQMLAQMREELAALRQRVEALESGTTL